MKSRLGVACGIVALIVACNMTSLNAAFRRTFGGITGLALSCDPCFVPNGTSNSNVGSASAGLTTGSFAGTWAIKTSGTDNVGTACSNYGSVIAITSGGQLSVTAGVASQMYPGVCLQATQASLSNSPYVQAFTITGTPNGAGWVLAFNDEFSGTQLENLDPQTPTSMSWVSSNGGQAAIVLPQMSPTNEAYQNVSIAGATVTSGSCANNVVNGTFYINTWTDPAHFAVYMPLSGCTVTGIGVSGATVSFGPWVTALTTSCSAEPCNGYPLLASNTNNDLEYWNPQNCTVSGGNLSIAFLRQNYTPPAAMQTTVGNGGPGTTASYQTCRLETGDAGSAFATLPRAYYDINVKVAYGQGLDQEFGALKASTLFPTEIDFPECYGGSPAPTSCDAITSSPTSGNTGGYYYNNSSPDFSAAFHQFAVDWDSAVGVTWYLDGASVGSAGTTFTQTTTPMFVQIEPEIGDTYSASPASTTFPVTSLVDYVRIYQHVSSNACYSTIPLSSQPAPYRGPCPASLQTPTGITSSGGNSISIAHTVSNGSTVTSLTVATSDSNSYTGWLHFDDTGGTTANGPFTGAYTDAPYTACTPSPPSAPTSCTLTNNQLIGKSRFAISGSNIITGRALTTSDVGIYTLVLVAEQNGHRIVGTITVTVT